VADFHGTDLRLAASHGLSSGRSAAGWCALGAGVDASSHAGMCEQRDASSRGSGRARRRDLSFSAWKMKPASAMPSIAPDILSETAL